MLFIVFVLSCFSFAIGKNVRHHSVHVRRPGPCGVDALPRSVTQRSHFNSSSHRLPASPACSGTRPALPFLLTGLKRLEYRGYDSAGVGVVVPTKDGKHGLRVVKKQVSTAGPCTRCCMCQAVADRWRSGAAGPAYENWENARH